MNKSNIVLESAQKGKNIIFFKFNKKLLNTIVFDAIILYVLISIPVLSHIINIPLYLIEPMKYMLVVAIIISHKYNVFFIAAIMPFISNQITGHPIFPKNILIGAEQVFIVVVFYYLYEKYTLNKNLSLSVGIVFGKIFYYTIKMSLISIGMIAGPIISTPLQYQIISLVAINLLFLLGASSDRRK